MSEAVTFEVTRQVDAEALLSFLSERGFVATLERNDDRFDVDVTSAPSEHARLRADAQRAVARWLADSEPLLVPISVNEDVLFLSPPAA